MVFLIFSCFVFTTVAIRIVKKISRAEQYAVVFFSIFLGFLIDIPLDLKYHLYGYFSPGVQLAGFLPILILFPTSGVVFMNFFPFNKTLLKKYLYTLCWTIFCLIFEFLSIKSGYFYHNGWTYLYSAVTYPFLFYLHLLNLKFFKKLQY
jgi:hypothetical protein